MAALLALIVPSLADQAPAIVELGLTTGARSWALRPSFGEGAGRSALTPRQHSHDEELRAQIEWPDPGTLTPSSNNAETHPTEQIDKIAASSASFGFDQPIVVDTDGVLIQGMAAGVLRGLTDVLQATWSATGT